MDIQWCWVEEAETVTAGITLIVDPAALLSCEVRFRFASPV